MSNEELTTTVIALTLTAAMFLLSFFGRNTSQKALYQTLSFSVLSIAIAMVMSPNPVRVLFMEDISAAFPRPEIIFYDPGLATLILVVGSFLSVLLSLVAIASGGQRGIETL